MDHIEEKQVAGKTISIQFSPARKIWEVACWNADDTNHWYLEFTDRAEARKEYDRWFE